MTRWAILVALLVLGVGCASNPARPSGLPTVSLCPEGIAHFNVVDCPPEHLLDAEAQGHRTQSTRVTRDASARVVLAELVNGNGRAVENGSGEASWSYTYDGDADVPREIVVKDKHGTVIAIDRLSEGGAKHEHYDAHGAPKRFEDGSTATVRRSTFDARGRATRTESFNARGEAVRDEDGAYGYAYEFDDAGLVTRWTALAADGKPTIQQRWSTKVEIVRDARGAPMGRHPMDAAGAPILESNGTCGYRLELDAFGNPVRQTNVDTSGAPRADEAGIAITTFERDDHGNRTKLRLFDAANRPVPSKTGVAGFDVAFDDRGNVVRRTSVDLAGRPTLSSAGFARVDFVYDASDRTVEQKWFDAEGAPTTNESGVASMTFTYDARGNRTEERWFDRRGRLRSTKTGFALRKCAYDDEDHLRSCDTFDPAARRALAREGWYSHFENTLDARGLVVDVRYAAPGSAEPPDVHGGSRHQLERDELGTVRSEAYYDDAGTLVPTGISGSYARVETESDASGDAMVLTYFASDGAVVSRRAFERDGHGWVTSEVETGPGGKPIGAVAKTVIERDARGLQTVTRFLDASGKPVENANGIAAFERSYDDRGRAVRERFFGVSGAPQEAKSGNAGVDRTYDPYGRVVSETWVGADGAPKTTHNGWATKRTTYDALGFVIEIRYLDPKGTPVAMTNGIAGEKFERTRFGAILSYRTFGVEGEPIPVPGKPYFGWRAEFDDRGNAVKTVFLDANRRRMPGFLVAINTYDADDSLAEQRFVNIDDQPSVNVEGISIVRYDNDERGRPLRGRYFDQAGQPATTRYGAAETRWTYGPNGAVDESTLGVDGKPVTNTSGYATRRTRRGVDGKSATTYLDADGAEVTPKTPEAPSGD